MASSSSASSLSSSAWRSLPSKPGIYIYKNAAGKIIYVGKAKSLSDRVRSYFQPLHRLGPKTATLVSQIATLEHIEVASEVEALLLESKLIKKHQPHYNIAAKDDKSPYYIHLTREPFPRPLLTHASVGAIAGPFLSGQTARIILKQFRRIAPFCTATRPVKRPCLYSHLGLCQPCPGSADATNLPQISTVYHKNITRLRRLLSGKFSQVSIQLRLEMAAASKTQAYERAQQLKIQLQALDYLLNQPIRPEEYVINPNLLDDQRHQALIALQSVLAPYLSVPALTRIEMYDIANLQGTSATGAMTVALAGEPDSRAYRHFTIQSKTTPDDVSMLLEVLTRRLARSDWPTPDLIVLDGGKSQLSIINSLITKYPSLPPIIALAKREETLIIPTGNWKLKTENFTELSLPLDHPGLRLLLRLRDEAHRFSRRLHHKHRKTDSGL